MDSKTFVDASFVVPKLGYEVEFFTNKEELKIGTYCAPAMYTDKTPMIYTEAGLYRIEEIICWRYAPTLSTIEMAQVLQWEPPYSIEWH